MVTEQSVIEGTTAFLGSVEVLGMLPIEARQAVAQQTTVAARGAGESLVRAEDPTDAVIAVRAGLAGLLMERPDKRLSPIHVIGPRQLYGWPLLMDAEPAPIVPRCLTPAEVLIVPAGIIRRVLRESPATASRVYKEVGRLALAQLHATAALLLGEYQVTRLGTLCPFGLGSGMTIQVAFHQSEAKATCARIGTCPAVACPLAGPRAKGWVTLWPRP